MSLNEKVEAFLLANGALKVGFATVETLAGGPPSADLTYRLEGARSAVSFALPLDRDRIRAYLGKEERLPHEEDNLATNIRSRDLSWEVAGMLNEAGYVSKGTSANLKYRKEVANWQLTLPPDISHRYIAVRSGVGSFGWSGNVGLKDHGCAVLLGTCVTTADLEPTAPIPEGERFCDNCKMCVAACPVEMFERDVAVPVELGEVTFSHGARKTYLLCQFCCGGITGLDKSGKWSSWSPGRFEVPEDQQELMKRLASGSNLYAQRPPIPGGYDNPVRTGAKQHLTCGHCQLVCWGDKKETAKNLKLLHTSGCVLQEPDGSVTVLPADEAEQAFAAFDPAHRALYR